MTAVLVAADHRDDWPCDRPCPACDAPTSPVQLLPADADFDEWLTARRAGIGASEIAAVMGISPWESPFSLWHRKTNGWELNPTEEMSTGTRVEPVVAEWWADTVPDFVVGVAGLYASRARPWQIATPDRLVTVPTPEWWVNQTVAVLECKWTGSWHGWGDADTDDIPVYYRAQVLWQCDVMGVDTWYLAVLGPGGFRAYTGRRDEKDLAVMREAGRRFMTRLTAGDPPPLDDHTATLTTLKRLHPSLVDEAVPVDAALAAGVARARKLRHTAQKLCDRNEARLREAMGPANRAVGPDGRQVASRSVFTVGESLRRAYTVDKLNYPRSA